MGERYLLQVMRVDLSIRNKTMHAASRSWVLPKAKQELLYVAKQSEVLSPMAVLLGAAAIVFVGESAVTARRAEPHHTSHDWVLAKRRRCHRNGLDSGGKIDFKHCNWGNNQNQEPCPSWAGKDHFRDFDNDVGVPIMSLLQRLLEQPFVVLTAECAPTSTAENDSNYVTPSAQQQQQHTYLIDDKRPTDAERRSTKSEPSWFRRALHWCRVVDLPLPRLLRPNDPALRLDDAFVKQRKRDEQRLRELQQEMEQTMRLFKTQSATDKNQQPQVEELKRQMGLLASRQYEVLYGPHVTPQDRMDFLAQYGCTAWTVTVLQRLAALGQGRGYVELGAGHGQWARAIDEEHRRNLQLARVHKQQQQPMEPTAVMPPPSPRDFVLAYDDESRLPLDPNVYHPKTRPHAAYFGTVHRLRRPTSSSASSPSIDPVAALLCQ